MQPTGGRRIARAFLVAAGTLAALGLTACTAPPTTGTGDTVSSEAPAEPIAGTFDVGGGRQMYLECAGTGYPRVLIIPGQRAGVEEWQTVGEGQTAEPVFQQLAAQTRVCAYDRPGVPFNNEPVSRTDPAPMPSNADAMMTDLRALLEAAGEAGPTIIVAHSLGGLPGLLYAETYPEDVLGIILVDALTPTMRDAMTPEQWEVQKELLTGDIEETLVAYPDLERVDFDTSFDQVAAGLADLPEVPYIVITADQQMGPIAQQLVETGAARRRAGRRRLRPRRGAEDRATRDRGTHPRWGVDRAHRQRPHHASRSAAADRRHHPRNGGRSACCALGIPARSKDQRSRGDSFHQHLVLGHRSRSASRASCGWRRGHLRHLSGGPRQAGRRRPTG